MRRFTGACVVACAGTVGFVACDLQLDPNLIGATGDASTESQQIIDSGTDTTEPIEDAKAPEDTGAPDVVTDANDGGPKRKRVFVTSAAYAGNFGANGTLALQAADTRCANAAQAANLGGTFVAWMSIATPATTAASRLKEVGGWTLVDGKTEVAASLAVLQNGALDNAINIDEKGAAVANPQAAWTGTSSNGTANAATCNSFTAVNGVGVNGLGMAGVTTAKNTTWTQSGANGNPCAQALHIYCFEQ
jgi:hypothetical protein